MTEKQFYAQLRKTLKGTGKYKEVCALLDKVIEREDEDFVILEIHPTPKVTTRTWTIWTC